jgi:hypothetical protein
MLDQIYQDFTTKILPQIQDGLMISKDYFMDLFGRYVKYLIIVDALSILACIVAIVVPSYFAYKYRQQIMNKTGGGLFFALLFLLIPIMILFIKTTDLIKDIYIPEIRIMGQIQNFNR